MHLPDFTPEPADLGWPHRCPFPHISGICTCENRVSFLSLPGSVRGLRPWIGLEERWCLVTPALCYSERVLAERWGEEDLKWGAEASGIVLDFFLQRLDYGTTMEK